MLVSNKFCEKNRVIRELRAELESRPIVADPTPNPIDPEDQVDAKLLAEALKKIKSLEGLLDAQASDLDKARFGWEKTNSDLEKTGQRLEKTNSDLEKTERRLVLKEKQNKTLNDGLQGKDLEIQELDKELGGIEKELEAEVLEHEESNTKKDATIQELRDIIAARENANRSLQAHIAKLNAQIEAHLGKLG
jgi:chromosome segregation ATPase